MGVAGPNEAFVDWWMKNSSSLAPQPALASQFRPPRVSPLMPATTEASR